jgi:hypothetical protein
MTHEWTLDEAVLMADANIPECTLCHSHRRKGSEVGYYVPPEAMLDRFRPMGWPDDQPLTFWYRLCRRCINKGRQSAVEQLEAMILRTVEAEKN